MYSRAAKVFFLLVAALGVLAVRMVIINESISNSASRNVNTISVVASYSRGSIYDCNLQPLVNIESNQYIAIKPQISSLKAVSELILNEDKDGAYNQISQGKIGIVKASGYIDNTDGKSFNVISRYTDNGLAVHTIGYVDVDGKGVTGIEKYYNDILSDANGYLKVKCSVDAYGNVLEGVKLETQSFNYNSKAGVALTIDKTIQQICEDALVEFGIELGAAVVLDVKTSEIRAMASAPEFSQNNVALSLEDTRSPFVNRAITPYSVGSVFKVVVASAAVENGISTNTSFYCNGFTNVGITRFGCHKETGHGNMNMETAMAQSCNPYFINLAIMAGKDSICNIGKNLGLGTSVELADGYYTESGIMPQSSEIISNQDLANLAFGQGTLLASPLQMTAVYAAIANDGVYTAPSLMKSIVNTQREEIMKAELPVSRRAMSLTTAKTVQALLLNTVVNGSGNKAKPDNVEVAGKTATAQSGQFDENGNEKTQSWFCGYFPAENPKYAITVLKENGIGGSADCAPVFKYIAQRITEELG